MPSDSADLVSSVDRAFVCETVVSIGVGSNLYINVDILRIRKLTYNDKLSLRFTHCSRRDLFFTFSVGFVFVYFLCLFCFGFFFLLPFFVVCF